MPAKAAAQGTKPPSWGHSAQAQLLLGRLYVVPYVVVVVVTLFGPRFFWKIFSEGFLCRRHRKNTLWCRGAISSMGLGVPNMAKTPKTPVFEQKIIFKMPWGRYASAKKFYFGNSISSLFGGPICQILSFGRPHRTQQHYSAEKRPSKKRPLGPKSDN